MIIYDNDSPCCNENNTRSSSQGDIYGRSGYLGTSGLGFADKASHASNISETKIDKSHEKYSLIYDMLTGIRVAVSRNQAKNPKTIFPVDFKSSNKLAFDVVGNELAPRTRYDFKFKDYAPLVFRDIRHIFKIDATEYLVSLTNSYVLSEVNSPGKSGSFFYYSQDYRFIIKTIKRSEHKFLISLLEQYYYHIKEYPNTLISRITGLHRVKLPKGKKIHFVVMGNIFPQFKDVHDIFDIKGSTLNRETSLNDKKPLKKVVKKDINWIKSGTKLYLCSQKKELMMEQLVIDVSFLKRSKIVDYSLLIGIHYVHRGNREKLRDRTLSVWETGYSKSPESIGDNTKNSEKISLSDIIFENTGNAAPNERKYFTFYKDNGGFSSSLNKNKIPKELYFIGIIDILTPYRLSKKLECFFKSIINEKSEISSVNPEIYGKRFLDFIEKSVISTGKKKKHDRYNNGKHREDAGSSVSEKNRLDPNPGFKDSEDPYIGSIGFI